MLPSASTLAIIKACAIGALLICVWLHGNGKGKDAVRLELAEVRAEHAESSRELADMTAEVARQVREREAQYNTDSAAAADQFQKDKTDALSKRDAVIAGLRSDNLRLRQWWRPQAVSCASDAATEADPGRDAEDAERRATGAGDLVRIAAESDAWVSWLQAELIATRAVCGAR